MWYFVLKGNKNFRVGEKKIGSVGSLETHIFFFGLIKRKND